jgi:hypothetical protein
VAAVRALVVAVAALALTGAAAAAPSPGELLSRYRPALSLHPQEPFRPVPVDPFVAASTLEQRVADGWAPAAQTLPLPTADPAGCGRTGALPCWRLDVGGCRADGGAASEACYAALQPAAGTAVYGRFLRAPGRLVLQYWLFYVYDFWTALPRSGLVWRSHEGDWEQATLVLTRGGTPLYAAYGQHCNGARASWSRVRKVARTHPLVYVARGSHAGYFRPGIHKHDLACYPQAVRTIFRVNAIAPVDYSAATRPLVPPVLRLTSRAPEWSAFPGAWGERGFFHAPGVSTRAFGYGPYGPAFHSVWRAPIREVSRWRVSR